LFKLKKFNFFKLFKSENCSNLKKFKFQKTQKKIDKYNLKPFKTAKPKPEKKNRTKLDSVAFWATAQVGPPVGATHSSAPADDE
jgi:hypothetical protein